VDQVPSAQGQAQCLRQRAPGTIQLFDSSLTLLTLPTPAQCLCLLAGVVRGLARVALLINQDTEPDPNKVDPCVICARMQTAGWAHLEIMPHPKAMHVLAQTMCSVSCKRKCAVNPLRVCSGSSTDSRWPACLCL
jgi:hypothetical protein